MITEILEKANEELSKSEFEIVAIELGQIASDELLNDIKKSFPNFQLSGRVNKYMNIPISSTYKGDEIVIKIKKIEKEEQPF